MPLPPPRAALSKVVRGTHPPLTPGRPRHSEKLASVRRPPAGVRKARQGGWSGLTQGVSCCRSHRDLTLVVLAVVRNACARDYVRPARFARCSGLSAVGASGGCGVSSLRLSPVASLGREGIINARARGRFGFARGSLHPRDGARDGTCLHLLPSCAFPLAAASSFER